MLWYLAKRGFDRKRLVLIACKCARLGLKYVPKKEKRPLKAIQTAEAWATGKDGVTLGDVRAAARAAYAANAAYAAYAANAARAAYAANAAYAAYAAANAAYTSGETLVRCADIIRKQVSAKEAVELGRAALKGGE
jgi:hypothetical protein